MKRFTQREIFHRRSGDIPLASADGEGPPPVSYPTSGLYYHPTNGWLFNGSPKSEMGGTLFEPQHQLGNGLLDFSNNAFVSFSAPGMGVADGWVMRTALNINQQNDGLSHAIFGVMDASDEFVEVGFIPSGGTATLRYINSLGSGGNISPLSGWVYVVLVSNPFTGLNLYINGVKNNDVVGDDSDVRPNTLLFGVRPFGNPFRVNQPMYAGFYQQQLPLYDIFNGSKTPAEWDTQIAAEYASLSFPS